MKFNLGKWSNKQTRNLDQKIVKVQKIEMIPNRGGNFMKALSRITILSLVTFALVGCSSPSLELPDYSGTSAPTAETALAGLGLIPVIEEEASDLVPQGNVIRTNPQSGSILEPGSRVTIVVSSGASSISAVDSYMEWEYVGSGVDNWEFEHPYIENDELVVRATPEFSRSFSWHAFTDGKGYGLASVNDSFDKGVPLRIESSSETVSANETQDFVIRIPLAGIEVIPPTVIHMRLFIQKDGSYSEIPLVLTMTW
jgi:hypothetical protein